ANYNGTDSFTYTATDGGLTSDPATVTITVTAVNDIPVAIDDTFTTNEDTVLTGNILTNDTDVEGSTLTAAVVTGPSHGALVLNANGSFTYTPVANYNGSDSFTYTATDGSLTSDPATVTITVTAVNDTPVAVDDSFTTNEDTVLTGNILTNDSDVEGSNLTTAVVTGPGHGALVLNANGSFTYTPAANYNGTDSFTYTASDGTATSPAATVTITITAVNDTPTAVDDGFTTNEDTQLTGNVLTNDSDVEGSNLTTAVMTGPSHGALVLNPDGSFTYTPVANYNGPDSFTYTATDGTATSPAATVTITITAVNDTPVAVDDSGYTVAEDGTLSIGSGAGVLVNDTDVENSSLTATLVTDPTHGALVLNTDGSFTYTPVANYNGSDSFTYTASDGQATSTPAIVTITVTAVNDTPAAVHDTFTTNEDTQLAGNVLTNDTDVEGSTLTASLVTGPAHGALVLNPNGSFTYTPTANYNGTDSFAYTASDGSLTSPAATVTITITAVNDTPVAVDDTFTTNEDTQLAGNVLTNDSDVENASLTAILDSGPGHGALVLNGDGTFTYTPVANYNGPDSFTYTATDGSATSAAATVSITVTAVDDTPVAIDDGFTTNEDTQLTGNVLTNDTDI
ncbi:Ig-like domain-containing protein, partial [Mycobacterium sp. URHB0044]|uniref:tandem-95 repeat protein n=1 Tax=Mycobacterium sp. URHB0044 TaxID=1380386 RepID=UPI0018CC608E